MTSGSLVALLGLAAVLVAVGLLGRRLRRRAATTATAPAEAEVLRVWRDANGAYYVDYRFTPPGSGAAVTGTAYGGCLRAGLPEPGAWITVLYDPSDPGVSRLSSAVCSGGGRAD